MSLISITSENIDQIDVNQYNFFVKEGDRIMYLYEKFQPYLLDLPANQTLVASPKSVELKLPKSWYYAFECPDYIKVTDVNTFDRKETDLNKVYEVSTSTTTTDNNVTVLFKIKHKAYTHVSSGSALGPSEINTGMSEIPEGADMYRGAGTIEYNDVNYNLSFVNGRAEISLDWSDNRENQFYGYVIINDIRYWTFTQVTLPSSISNLIKKENFIAERNKKLEDCDWMVVRHITQQAAGVETTLSDAQFKNLSIYMQSLRDMPENMSSYENIMWPSLQL